MEMGEIRGRPDSGTQPEKTVAKGEVKPGGFAGMVVLSNSCNVFV